MRLYGGRKINRSIDRRFRTHTESRDAIVWDVDQSNGIARCKVQGSDELVQCHYQQNWQTLPYYVKPGFAIRIIHKGGQKGFQEITGPGRAIPSSVYGPVVPPNPSLFNTIISGIVPSAPGGGMYIALTNGVFRIGGLNYVFSIGDGGVTMGGDEYIMDPVTGMLMAAGTNALLVLDPAPEIPLGRYDLVILGADGIAHVVTGEASADPVVPVYPLDHIVICRVLVLGGVTEILQKDIGGEWELLRAYTIGIAGRSYDNKYHSSTNGMVTKMLCSKSLTATTPPIHMRATILDQNGWPIVLTTTMTITIDMGTGSLHQNLSSEGGSSLSLSGTASYFDFVYRRDESTYGGEPAGTEIFIGHTILDDPSSPEYPGAVAMRFSITQIIGIYFSHMIELEWEDPDHPEWGG